MKQKGFTLIELLVVVAIIGTLAAIGVLAYDGYTSNAKKNASLTIHQQVVKYITNELIYWHFAFESANFSSHSRTDCCA